MDEQDTVNNSPKGARIFSLENFRRRRVMMGIALVLALSAGYLWWHGRAPAVQYVTAPVTNGNIVQAVVATGTVNPVTTVQVGSYVSGTIQHLYCDYNTKVKAGQLCAKVDPRPYQVLYDQAAANLASAEAQLKKDQASLTYAQINYTRDLGLEKQGIVSQDALDVDKSALDQAKALVNVDEASISQRRAALYGAKVNLDYTDIISPVDGTVVSRSIDVGQTVAASFQTPTLFLIAKDLTQMQVDTNVSESDVGNAKVGQRAVFTVEAYPDKPFQGKVVQVRQAPVTVQNIVTYDVVIGVKNPEFKLFPGMTANTRIITAERDNVLRVPIQALRFSPERRQRNNKPAGPFKARSHGQNVYLLVDGKPRKTPVTVGLNDGVNAEISGEGIKEGYDVIVNEIMNGQPKTKGPTRSPLRF